MGRSKLESFRPAVRVNIAILLGYLLVSASSSVAQLRSDLAAQEQLSEAINSLDADAVREAVRAGADPNYHYEEWGLSVLNSADMGALLGSAQPITAETEERLIAIYDVLFQLGARLGPDDDNILHGSAIAGAPRVAKYLLERGADPNGEDSYGNTPVILATKSGHPEVIAVLLAGGAKPLDSLTEAQILMAAAARRGDLMALRHELRRGADVNRKGPGGETALVEAIKGGIFRGGNLEMVHELLNLGASPNLSGHFITDTSPLHVAVLNNERAFESDNGPAIVEALLKAGAHVSSTEYGKKQTPLHVAAQTNNTKAAILLLEAGASVMPRDEDGKTPLDLAESSGMIALLKARGATEE
jgi:ankyrin repeat protein